MRPSAKLRLVLAVGGGAVLLAAAAGCYRKIVNAQGFGADAVAVEDANLPPDKGTRTLGYPKVAPKRLPGE
jgi:hypothetical protein